MSGLASLVRFVRPATDVIAPYSFNRMGFALNRHGFEPGDLPEDAQGRIALVTGANSGIGLAASQELARRNFKVWLLCRDAERGKKARDTIARAHGEDRARLAIVDLSSLASIRRFVVELDLDRVDVLVHNAGVLPAKKTLSPDRIEVTFATSVIGPFALTGLLLPRLRRSTDARVIFVASGGMYAQKLDLAMPEVAPESFDGVTAYANAKRAEVLLAHAFAARLSSRDPITFASMHPGWAETEAVRTSLPTFHRIMGPFLRTPAEGADTVVWLAASERARGTDGAFWFDRRVAPEYPFPWTHESQAAREELFATCERLSGLTIPGAPAAA